MEASGGEVFDDVADEVVECGPGGVDGGAGLLFEPDVVCGFDFFLGFFLAFFRYFSQIFCEVFADVLPGFFVGEWVGLWDCMVDFGGECGELGECSGACVHGVEPVEVGWCGCVVGAFWAAGVGVLGAPGGVAAEPGVVGELGDFVELLLGVLVPFGLVAGLLGGGHGVARFAVFSRSVVGKLTWVGLWLVGYPRVSGNSSSLEFGGPGGTWLTV